MSRFLGERTEPVGATLEEEFAALVRWLERDASHSSRIKDSIDHPAFKKIVAYGRAVLPLIGARDGASWWEFSAITAITGGPEIPEEARGKLLLIRPIYRQWLAGLL